MTITAAVIAIHTGIPLAILGVASWKAQTFSSVGQSRLYMVRGDASDLRYLDPIIDLNAERDSACLVAVRLGLLPRKLINAGDSRSLTPGRTASH